MVRTQISLTPEQHRRLADLASTTGRSMSDLVRAALDDVYGERRRVEEDLEDIRRAFGAWGDLEPDGATYVERVRSGDRVHPK